MAERSDQMTEESLEDDEANQALDEAQAVMDRIESGDSAAPSGSRSGAAGVSTDRETESTSDDGSLLPSPGSLLPSVPSLQPSEWFSKEFFLGSLVVVGGAAFVGRMVLFFLGKFGGYLGLFLASFVLAAASSERRYLEIGLASLVASGLFAFLANLSILGLFTAQPIRAALLGGGVGLLIGLVGAYLGRDLRSGLSRDVGGGDDKDEPPI